MLAQGRGADAQHNFWFYLQIDFENHASFSFHLAMYLFVLVYYIKSH